MSDDVRIGVEGRATDVGDQAGDIDPGVSGLEVCGQRVDSAAVAVNGQYRLQAAAREAAGDDVRRIAGDVVGDLAKCEPLRVAVAATLNRGCEFNIVEQHAAHL